jgi:hypothetical protein
VTWTFSEGNAAARPGRDLRGGNAALRLHDGGLPAMTGQGKLRTEKRSAPFRDVNEQPDSPENKETMP